MSFIFTILDGIFSLVSWFKGNKDQEIGAKLEENTDLKSENKALRQELKDATNMPDNVTVLDSLRKHHF